MTAVPLERPVGLAVVAELEDALGAGRAGYGAKPASGGLQSDGSYVGYAIVYPGSTVPGAGTAAAPNADAAQTVQVTYVGGSADVADTARDLGRAALLAPGALATIAGRALVNPVQLVDASPARKDDQVQHPSWYAVDRYLVQTTPA